MTLHIWLLCLKIDWCPFQLIALNLHKEILPSGHHKYTEHTQIWIFWTSVCLLKLQSHFRQHWCKQLTLNCVLKRQSDFICKYMYFMEIVVISLCIYHYILSETHLYLYSLKSAWVFRVAYILHFDKLNILYREHNSLDTDIVIVMEGIVG